MNNKIDHNNLNYVVVGTGDDVAMNLKLSINFILYVISISLFSIFFFIGTENAIYFSVFSPKHSKLPSDSFTSSLIMKWES